MITGRRLDAQRDVRYRASEPAVAGLGARLWVFGKEHYSVPVDGSYLNARLESSTAATV